MGTQPAVRSASRHEAVGWGQEAQCRESVFDLHFIKPIDSKALEPLVAAQLRAKLTNG